VQTIGVELPSATLTAVTSSLTVTSPLRLQSPAQAMVGGVTDAVVVAVAAGVGVTATAVDVGVKVSGVWIARAVAEAVGIAVFVAVRLAVLAAV
jgi:hypothetical protein